MTVERINRLVSNDRAWMAMFAGASAAYVAGFAPALLALLSLAWCRRQTLAQDVRSKLDSLPSTAIWVVALIVPVSSVYQGGTPPLDDLLRHVTAWQHQYDYTTLYQGLDPRFPHVSMWIGFEVVTGWICKHIGFLSTAFLVQGICYALTAWVAIAIASSLIREDQPSREVWRIALFSALLVAGLLQRAVLARPEAFLAVWALSACVLRPALWVAIGLMLMPSYWLAVIYAPAAVLLRTNLRNQVLCAASLVAASVAFWWTYAGPEWPAFFALVHDWTVTRLAAPGESLPIQAAMFNPVFLLIVGAYILRQSSVLPRGLGLACLVLAAWFLLPGQVRYVGIVGPLLVITAANGSKLPRLSTSASMLVLAGSVMALLATAPSKSLASLPQFSLPSGATLLTEFDTATYFLPAINPGIRSAPAMEFGAISQPLQAASLALSGRGKLDCTVIRQQGITHVIEQHLQAQPDCLALDQFNSQWRLWHVIP